MTAADLSSAQTFDLGTSEHDLAPGPNPNPSGPPDAAMGPSSSLVMVATSQAGPLVAHSFTNGAWSAGTTFAGASLGGVTVGGDGDPFVAATQTTTASDSFASGVWKLPNGTWTIDYGPDSLYDYEARVMSQPVATVSGVALAYQTTSGTVFAEYGPSWSVSAPTNLLGGTGALALALEDAGAPLLVGYGYGPLGTSGYPTQGYNFTERSGSMWSAFAQFWSEPATQSVYIPAIALAPLVGKGSLVAAFLTGADGGAEVLRLSTFSSGTWSTPLTISASMNASQGATFSLASLPDGRVALAYDTVQQGAVQVGFWDGTTWSASHAPGVAATAIALAPGATGAELELAFVRADEFTGEPALWHTRLTNEASNAWTDPAEIDDSRPFARVALTRGP